MSYPIRRAARAVFAGLVAVPSILALGALWGCRSDPAPAARPDLALPPSLAASMPAQVPIAVTDIELGNRLRRDKRVVRVADRFGVHDTIYAVVSTIGQAANAVLAAKWSYSSGQYVDSTSRAVAPNGPAVTEFHVSRKTPWPTGSYQVEIYLDGTPAGIRHFMIAAP
jgi:hypothetical protein